MMIAFPHVYHAARLMTTRRGNYQGKLSMNAPAEGSRYRAATAYARRLLDRVAERRHKMGTFRVSANLRRTPAQRVADFLNRKMGSVPFLVLHLGLFVLGVSMNLRLVSGL